MGMKKSLNVTVEGGSQDVWREESGSVSPQIYQIFRRISAHSGSFKVHFFNSLFSLQIDITT